MGKNHINFVAKIVFIQIIVGLISLALGQENTTQSTPVTNTTKPSTGNGNSTLKVTTSNSTSAGSLSTTTSTPLPKTTRPSTENTTKPSRNLTTSSRPVTTLNATNTETTTTYKSILSSSGAFFANTLIRDMKGLLTTNSITSNSTQNANTFNTTTTKPSTSKGETTSAELLLIVNDDNISTTIKPNSTTHRPNSATTLSQNQIFILSLSCVLFLSVF